MFNVRVVPNTLPVARFFAPLARPTTFDEDLVTGTWSPAIDIAEFEDRLVVTAEVPGMNRDQFSIEFHNGVLTIQGERKFDEGTDNRKLHRVERSYGKFVRSFTMPRLVDAEAIAARYVDGILEVTIPKRAEAKAKQIRIGE